MTDTKLPTPEEVERWLESLDYHRTEGAYGVLSRIIRSLAAHVPCQTCAGSSYVCLGCGCGPFGAGEYPDECQECGCPDANHCPSCQGTGKAYPEVGK